MKKNNSDPRQNILEAACKIFANCGYAGASVQDIVDKAGITKPTLYYYFGSKAGLFQALVDYATDQRYELMREAVNQHHSFKKQLVEMVDSLIQFAHDRTDLLKIVSSIHFAAPGELPPKMNCSEKRLRNFEFAHSLIKQGLKSGELDSRFGSREITEGIISQILFYSMSYIVCPQQSPRRGQAEKIVQLFLEGAGAK